jgi:hypothetical protein
MSTAHASGGGMVWPGLFRKTNNVIGGYQVIESDSHSPPRMASASASTVWSGVRIDAHFIPSFHATSFS